MKLINNGIIKFDQQIPIYNFFYPFQGSNLIEESLEKILNVKMKSRALYFHIPFCETICTFCPFTRGIYKSKEVIDAYVDALINEIQEKSKLADFKETPIKAIFFGGGTPSLLSKENIIALGTEIHKHFDLTNLKEFSFEMELKSITEDKILAMKEIGVTHPRFGLQTFNQKWRKLFNLTSTIEQIHNSIELLNKHFKYVSFDILYGMSGQDESEIILDLTKATALGNKNIDIYPINNISTQAKLHKEVAELGLEPTSAMRKFSMRILIDEFMRSKGFMPHNGHGYHKSRVSDKILSKDYNFVYHEHVYGYADHDLLGFGVTAISLLKNNTLTNYNNRNTYIKEKGKTPITISSHTTRKFEERPLILRLAYFGCIDKNKVNFESINKETLNKLKQLISSNLIKETSTSYELTKDGWLWYTNIMFYLMPEIDQEYMKHNIFNELNKPHKNMLEKEVILM